VNSLVCVFGSFNRIERDFCAVGVNALAFVLDTFNRIGCDFCAVV